MLLLGHIFYAFGLLIFLLDLIHLFGFSKIYKVSEWTAAFKKINKKNPKKIDYRNEEDYNFSTFHTMFVMLEFFWLLFGLISASWSVYFVIIALGFLLTIVKKISTKLIGSEFNTFNRLITYPYLMVKCMLILALIINHFHLHIDLIKLI